MVFGLIAGGCALLFGGAAVVSLDEAIQESVGLAQSTDYEITVDACELDFADDPEARGSITNTSDIERSYEVTVTFTNPNGSLITTDSTTTDRLQPGQSTAWRVTTFTEFLADPGFSCDVKEVRYSVFGR